ncbi:MAG: hypothetical protein R3F62_24450 [Planctomycetota bacterium]
MEGDAPYRPPEAEVADEVHAPSESETIRRHYVNEEWVVRGTGLVSSMLALGLLRPLLDALRGGELRYLPGESPAAGWALVALLVVTAVTGMGVQALAPAAFSVALGLCLLFPAFAWVTALPRHAFGVTLLCGVLLAVLSRRPARYVFSASYARIRAETPHVRGGPRAILGSSACSSRSRWWAARSRPPPLTPAGPRPNHLHG